MLSLPCCKEKVCAFSPRCVQDMCVASGRFALLTAVGSQCLPIKKQTNGKQQGFFFQSPQCQDFRGQNVLKVQIVTVVMDKLTTFGSQGIQ